MGGAILSSSLLAAYKKVDTSIRWHHELLPFDERVKDNFSISASGASDLLLTTTIITPLILQIGPGFDEPMGRRTLIYVETITANFFLNTLVKFSVTRPRPYTYNRHPRVMAYISTQHDQHNPDSHLSFYSGHASTAFAAAVAGSYLFRQTSTDKNARAVIWGIELAMAGAIANLRVKAGKHFYSDVIVGTVIGAGLGFIIPYLHQRPLFDLSTVEAVTIGCAPVVGVVLSELVSFNQDIIEPLEPMLKQISSLQITPWLSTSGGGGFLFTRLF